MNIVTGQNTPAAVPEFAPWMSYEEVLEELDVARSTMDRWRADSRAPRFVRLPNGALRIRRDRLEEWLEGLAA
jgi:predicted DNA-binding transcriptional regulator AlpA